MSFCSVPPVTGEVVGIQGVLAWGQASPAQSDQEDLGSSHGPRQPSAQRCHLGWPHLGTRVGSAGRSVWLRVVAEAARGLTPQDMCPRFLLPGSVSSSPAPSQPGCCGCLTDGMAQLPAPCLTPLSPRIFCRGSSNFQKAWPQRNQSSPLQLRLNPSFSFQFQMPGTQTESNLGSAPQPRPTISAPNPSPRPNPSGSPGCVFLGRRPRKNPIILKGP